MFEFFATKQDDGYGGFYYSLTTAGYIVILLAALLLVLSVAFLVQQASTEKKKMFSVKQLVFCSAAIALAVAASMLKLPVRMPMGGSATFLSMLFICLTGYWYGPKIGVVTALAYGALQLIIEPYIISVPQMLVDYLFAFGALGLSGFFRNSKNGLVKGYLFGILGRFLFAFLSGLIFFSQYASSYNMIPVVYSAAYNGSYIGTEAVITLIIIALPPVSNALKQVKRYANEA